MSEHGDSFYQDEFHCTTDTLVRGYAPHFIADAWSVATVESGFIQKFDKRLELCWTILRYTLAI